MIPLSRTGPALLVLLVFLSGGCAPGGLGLDWEPWERNYYRHGGRIVVDRFEIDVRNTEALQQVIDHHDKRAVINAAGRNNLYQNDLEVIAVETGLAEAMREAPHERTIRRTTQHACSVPPHSSDRNPLRLPEGCKGDRPLVLPPGSANTDPATGAGMTHDQAFELVPGRRSEEGMEVLIRSTVRFGADKAERISETTNSRSRATLHDIPLFLKPGESVVLRTNPTWADGLPAILRFKENGQAYETVYLISYVVMERPWWRWWE